MMTRLAAAMHGEVSASTVEAYRRAGGAAYQDMTDAEQLRASLAASGAGLWGGEPRGGKPAAMRVERVRAADPR